ncbi:hypothetical protein RN001_009067 [Aquatica leii]|uniref:folate gamma-glutamyl hydrolase n=1 Tax=Aquatica leii TaxID=1421715 RepID=A0AAN7P852_9COLE|nr:hypothetical protein RN001_009067 [Aquatica leii]
MKAIIILLSTISLVTAYTTVPIIGILSQETYSIDNLFPEKYDSFIAASYVKLLESAGARVIPIWIGQNKDYYHKVVDNTNGIVFPGGAVYFNQTCGYSEAGQIIYNYAVKLNRNGDYYPIWGICLGMELLMEVAVGLSNTEVRETCSSTKISLPLEFKNGYRTSKTFKNASHEVIHILTNENVTYNYHQFCVTEKGMKDHGLDKDWKVLSTNKDENGLEFVSSYESKLYPFYAMEDKVDAILKKLEEMEVVQVRMEQKLDALQAELDNLKKEHTKLTEKN